MPNLLHNDQDAAIFQPTKPHQGRYGNTKLLFNAVLPLFQKNLTVFSFWGVQDLPSDASGDTAEVLISSSLPNTRILKIEKSALTDTFTDGSLRHGESSLRQYSLRIETRLGIQSNADEAYKPILGFLVDCLHGTYGYLQRNEDREINTRVRTSQGDFKGLPIKDFNSNNYGIIKNNPNKQNEIEIYFYKDNMVIKNMLYNNQAFTQLGEISRSFDFDNNKILIGPLLRMLIDESNFSAPFRASTTNLALYALLNNGRSVRNISAYNKLYSFVMDCCSDYAKYMFRMCATQHLSDSTCQMCLTADSVVPESTHEENICNRCYNKNKIKYKGKSLSKESFRREYGDFVKSYNANVITHCGYIESRDKTLGKISGSPVKGSYEKFGIELEYHYGNYDYRWDDDDDDLDDDDDEREQRHEVNRTFEEICFETLRMVNSFAILKRDSSVSGFELVTSPGTANTLKKRLRNFFYKIVEPKNIPLYTDDNSGMHVHISRAYLSPLQLGKLLLFLNNQYYPLIKDICGRDSDEWASVQRHRLADSIEVGRRGRFDRHSVVNLTNDHTIEIRAMQSPSTYFQFCYRLEFILAACLFCKDSSIQNLTSEAFKEFVLSKSRKGYFPDLSRFLVHNQN